VADKVNGVPEMASESLDVDQIVEKVMNCAPWDVRALSVPPKVETCQPPIRGQFIPNPFEAVAMIQPAVQEYGYWASLLVLLQKIEAKAVVNKRLIGSVPWLGHECRHD
jgi:hypothetical protein